MKEKSRNYKQNITDYIRMLKPFWMHDRLLVLAMIFTQVLGQFMGSVGNLIFLQLVLNQIDSGTSNAVEVSILILVVFAVEITTGMFGPVINAHYVTPHIEKTKMKINNEIFLRLKNTDYQYFDNPQFYDTFTVTYGEYANRSVQAVQDLAGDIGKLFALIGILTFIIAQNWWVVLVSVVNMFLNTLLSFWWNRLAKEREDKTAKSERSMAYFKEKLISRDAAMDIKLTKIQNIFSQKYNAAVEENIRTNRRMDTKSLFYFFWTHVLSDVSGAIIRITTCALFFAGKVGIGAMVTLLSAYSQLSSKMQSISQIVEHFHKYSLDGERVRRFLELPSPIEQTQGISDMKTETDGCFEYEFRNVSFAYSNSSFALKKINMRLKAGDKIAIVGENGGGKTTLTKLLLRLYDPQEGEILLNGRPLTEYNADTVRHGIGIAFQDSPIYAMTMRENLSVYTPVSDEGIQQMKKYLPLEGILSKNNAGYDSPITRQFNDHGMMLSGGEKQMLSVARTMTKAFGLLIFDEPTAALDPLTEERLSQAILSAANRTTTILISHRLSNVINADYIYVVKNGEIIESGKHSDLMERKGYYSEMFLMQAKNYQKINE